MSELIVSTLTVSYDPDAEKDQWNNGEGLSLERHTGFTGLKTGIPFRQYPQCPANLVSSHGTITKTPEYRVSDETEVVVFSGSNTASLKRSVATSVQADVVSGVSFDETGKVVYPTVTYDESKNQLVSDIAFYGAVNVTYQAPYSLHFYEFETEQSVLGGTTIYSDKIHAFYKKNHAELEMAMEFNLTSQWLPLYKVTSQIVLDELGVWEYPPNWATTDTANKTKTQDDPNRTERPEGEFPGWTTHKIDPNMSFTDDRVHQIAEYDILGRIRISTPNEIIDVQEPYWSSVITFYSLANRNPPLVQFHLKWATKPTWKKSMSYSEQNWMDAFLSIDSNKIKAELEADYPNIKKDGNG